MKDVPELDRRPVIVAVAGPNGAGKTTFYHAHIAPAALRYVNADVLAKDTIAALLTGSSDGVLAVVRIFRAEALVL